MLFPALSLVLAPVAVPAGQAGDHAGEEQPPLPADLIVPPAPPLSPEEALASFAVAPGFRVELVAAEPLVEDPVACAFDGDGRLWVCEMRGFMPDVDGTHEDAPVGVIAVLADTDGDGRMDERTVFLDGLVLPRAVQPALDGALVIAPPEMFFARDTDGDGRADERTLIDTNLGGIASPEHAINGFLYTLDNWYRCANAPVRYRRDADGEWERGATAGGGQWGITRDDVGRALYNTNSDPLRGDLYPSHYAVRNPNHGTASGVNVRLAQDFAVSPSRITPGVNRGYQAGILRDDFRLAKFTAACAPLVFRGHGFPADFAGNAFVCEPAGNLVKRYRLLETDGIGLTATPAPGGDAPEFLSSTDERFRPVNLMDGPDGALYVVDLYRGVLQHRMFVTSFLRRQIEERGLERPLGLGRIWRVVHEDAPEAAPVRMSTWSWTELVAALSHPSGWVRDNAQRILVEEGRGVRDALEVLREGLPEATPLGRLHALWVLDGIGALREADVLAALADGDARVRRTAMRLAERWMATGSKEATDRVVGLGAQGDQRDLHQALLSLGDANTDHADDALLFLCYIGVPTAELRGAALSGLAGRELSSLERLLHTEGTDAEEAGRPELLELLARAVAREGRGDRIERLLTVIADARPAWQRGALARGVLAGRPKGPRGEPAPIRLAAEPAGFASVLAAGDLTSLHDAVAWPGRPGFESLEIRPLEPEEAQRFERGRALYAATCASCHLPSGLGDPGQAPPLRHSLFVLGDEERLAKIVLHGLVGPLELEDARWDAEMPAWIAPDDDLAALLTYLRREWGHGADPVTPATIARVREATAGRSLPWTVEELSYGVSHFPPPAAGGGK